MAVRVGFKIASLTNTVVHSNFVKRRTLSISLPVGIRSPVLVLEAARDIILVENLEEE